MQKFFSPNAYKINKTFHLVFVVMWLGAAFSLILGQVWFRVTKPVDGIEWILRTLDFIDWFILVPGATGVVITGVIFSMKTKWGWGKDFYWIRAKWIIATIGVIVGTFMLAPWMHDMIVISSENQEFLKINNFLSLSSWILIFGGLQVLTLVYAIYLSIFKPK